jgi:hypothetical protein
VGTLLLLLLLRAPARREVPLDDCVDGGGRDGVDGEGGEGSWQRRCPAAPSTRGFAA